MIYQTENFNGNYDFRCRIHDGWHVDNHIHEYSEFLYTCSGECVVFINGRQIQVPEKHLLWIPPNYIHGYQCENALVVCAVFSNDFIPLFFRLTQGKSMTAAPVDFSDMSTILEKFHTLDRKNKLLISGYLNLICARVVECSAFEKSGHADGILYQKVISYLSSHFRDEVSLKLLAKKFGYNEKYLSHSLYELTGIHFSKLLAMYRIEYAKELLVNKKSAAVSEIALASGFSAINSFNRVFKEFTGMTPTEYRKDKGLWQNE